MATNKMTQPTKTCARCGQTKPLTDFRKKTDSRRPGKIYHYSYCRTCSSSYNKEYTAALSSTPGVSTTRRIKSMSFAQDEVKTYCEICKAKDVTLYANYSPKTGKYKGTLCENCATGLFCYNYNKKIMERALSYLAR